MKTLFAVTMFVAAALPAAAEDASLIDQAKSQQSKDVQRKRDDSARDKLLKSRTQELAKVLGKVVSDLESQGFAFERVQGESGWNLLMTEFGSKVVVQGNRKPPRIILKPKAGPRIYAELAWDCPRDAACSSLAVTFSNEKAAETVKGPKKAGKLSSMQGELKKALLKLIAAKAP